MDGCERNFLLVVLGMQTLALLLHAAVACARAGRPRAETGAGEGARRFVVSPLAAAREQRPGPHAHRGPDLELGGADISVDVGKDCASNENRRPPARVVTVRVGRAPRRFRA